METAYTRIIGDTHGRYEGYKSIAKFSEHSVQIGDFGFGFDQDKDWHIKEWQRHNPQHTFIRGNHDDPGECETSDNYLGDYSYFTKSGVMYIGGAWSIDYYHRTEGVNWWPDEELSQKEFDEVERLYLLHKPRVVISHDAPYSMPIKMGLLNPAFGGPIMTRTGYRLDLMFRQHQPKNWFFGHYHKTVQKDYLGCHFHCLGELDYADFDFENLSYKPVG